MQGILDAFDFIISTIKSVWDFFIGIVDNLILFIQYLMRSYVLVIECVMHMPSWLQMFAFLTFSVCVLYLILGRGSGKSE